jgi:hypothetical protein
LKVIVLWRYFKSAKICSIYSGWIRVRKRQMKSQIVMGDCEETCWLCVFHRVIMIWGQSQIFTNDKYITVEYVWQTSVIILAPNLEVCTMKNWKIRGIIICLNSIEHKLILITNLMHNYFIL